MCRLTRRATVIAGAIAALTVSATTAAAESGYVAGYCNQLQAQYRAARASTGQSGGRVGAQIAQATRSLAQARADARRYGCLGGFPFFNNRPQCASITSQIDRLSQALYRLRGGSNWFGDPNAEVARLASLMRDSGCDTPQPGNGLSLAGGDRALCVRVCDGYFFPIEFNVRRSRLKVDAAVCQSMYAKDGQAALFVTRDADVANATSLSGARYGDQPYAFRYTEGYDAQCAAQLHTGIAALATRYLSLVPSAHQNVASSDAPTIPLPLPRPRPAASEDPETLANAAGDFHPTAPVERKARIARIVGPAYYAQMYDHDRPAKQPVQASTFSFIGEAAAAEAPDGTPANEKPVSQP